MWFVYMGAVVLPKNMAQLSKSLSGRRMVSSSVVTANPLSFSGSKSGHVESGESGEEGGEGLELTGTPLQVSNVSVVTNGAPPA